MLPDSTITKKIIGRKKEVIYPKTVRARCIFTPGESNGTRIILCCRYGLSFGSVFPIKIHILQFSFKAPDVHHFLPLMTYSLPSRILEHSIFRASEDATSGSV